MGPGSALGPGKAEPLAGPVMGGSLMSLLEVFHSVATGFRRKREFLTPVGLLVFGLTLAAVVVLGLYTDRALRMPELLPGRLGVSIGAVRGASWPLGPSQPASSRIPPLTPCLASTIRRQSPTSPSTGMNSGSRWIPPRLRCPALNGENSPGAGMR